MEMTSNFDVTNSAHQIQITTIRPWTNLPPMKIFCVRHWLIITSQLHRPLQWQVWTLKGQQTYY